MNWLYSLHKLIDTFTDRLGRIIAWLTLFMVLLTFTIVILRYGFNVGWIAMQESVLYLHGLVFMLGAGYTLKSDGHVRVDIFYQKFSPQKQAWVNLFGTALLLFPVVIFVFVISLDYVMTSWQIQEKSSEAGGLPFVFVSKTYLLLFAFTLGLQGLSELIKNSLTIMSAHTSRSAGEQ